MNEARKARKTGDRASRGRLAQDQENGARVQANPSPRVLCRRSGERDRENRRRGKARTNGLWLHPVPWRSPSIAPSIAGGGCCARRGSGKRQPQRAQRAQRADASRVLFVSFVSFVVIPRSLPCCRGILRGGRHWLDFELGAHADRSALRCRRACARNRRRRRASTPGSCRPRSCR